MKQHERYKERNITNINLIRSMRYIQVSKNTC